MQLQICLKGDPPRVTGAHIRYVLDLLDIRAYQLARLLDVSEGRISQWKHNRNTVPPMYARIIDAIIQHHSKGYEPMTGS